MPGGGAATPIAMAGPYYVASIGDGQTVVEKNPNYTGGRPRRVERIVYTGGVTPADAVARVQRGDADYVNGDILGFDPAGPLAPGGSIDRSYGPASRAGRAGRPRYVASPAPGIDGIAFNTRRPLFRDARMRRAVGYALDRTALAAVYGEQPSDHLIPPAVSGLDGNVAYPNEPDLTTARRLAGPGRRTARLYGCGDPIGVRIARIVRANLAPIGIDVHDRPVARVPERPGARAARRGGHAARVARRPQSRSGVRSSSSRSATGSRRPATGAPPSLQRRIASARGARGPREDRRLPAGSRRPSCATPHPSRSTRRWVNPEFFSERVGCRISQGALQVVDLGALCLG